jgi:hypothetical protein
VLECGVEESIVNVSPSNGREFASWKEIADYLGVNVRTAQKWETERGLPIRRLPGAGRGRVLVSAAELERWKQSGPPATPAARLPEPARLGKYWKWAAALALLVLVAAALWATLRAKPVPVSAHVQGNALIVFDARGRELWRKILPVEAYEPSVSLDRQQVWLGDIDGDGQMEVLYAYVPKAEVETPLFCFSHTGAEKWRFVPARKVATRLESFPPPYRPTAFAVIQPEPNAPKQIVVTSHHNLYYPDQVAVLDSSGRLLREYWHSGWIEALAAADLDGDGVPELYLGGISNSHRQAVLVVLDPRRLGGASHEDNLDYQLTGFGPPVETARVLFPRSCANRLSQPQNLVRQFFLSERELSVAVEEEYVPQPGPVVFWHFDAALHFSRVVLSDHFKSRHRELELTGAIQHHLTDDRSEFGDLTWLTKP